MTKVLTFKVNNFGSDANNCINGVPSLGTSRCPKCPVGLSNPEVGKEVGQDYSGQTRIEPRLILIAKEVSKTRE
jgi:hypothetical protein